jgi:uncharacterized protein YPO0396
VKQLKRLLLIHWHFFNFEIIDFDKINFLTGKNASGKSTMIDALQLIMLGDANGRHFFNKAANEKSSRSLKGYLRGELGDDGDTGFRYLREGRFTSYIACEFYDDVKRAAFTTGVVFECYEDGSDEHRFFVLNSEFPDNNFVVNNVPMTYKELRTYVNKNYNKGKYDFPNSDRAYQEILKGKFGGLKNKYFSLFRKAVSFSPITDIETFITEYVCDVKNPVDISLMQENIRYYKRLEYEADLMEERLAALEGISAKYKAFLEEKQRLEIQSYIIDRAKLQSAIDEIKSLKGRIEELDREIVSFSTKQAECSAGLVSERANREKLIEDKIRSDVHNKIEQLKARINELTGKIEDLKSGIVKVIQKLRRYAFEWREVCKNYDEILNDIPQNGIIASFAQEISEISNQAAFTKKHAKKLLNIDEKSIYSLSEKGFKEAIADTIRLKQTATGLKFSILKKKDQVKRDIQEKRKTLAELEKGIKSYDAKLLQLKDEIKKGLALRYGSEVPVYILADLLEIRDERWRNAIEAYLHTQKFYIIVEPEYFVEALKIYDRLKFENQFYDWGIVDTGKLERKRPGCEKGSLAEEIITGYKYARMFVDFVLGRVIKCNTVEELRNHDRSITNTCMLYQGYVARQLNPARWSYPFIGKNAVEEQIRNVKQFIEKADKEVATCDRLIEALTGAADMGVISENEWEDYMHIMEDAAALPHLEEQLYEVNKEKNGIDLTWLISLEEKIQESEEKIKQLESEEKDLIKRIAEAENQKIIIINEKIEEARHREKMFRQVLKENYSEDWVADKAEQRFIKELQSRSSANEVIDNFSSQLERTRSQTQKKKDDLESARSDYNREYKMSYDIKKADNSAYDRELEEISESRLPEYRNQIKDAKEKAFQQFGDDFLAKLKANIDLVKTQTDELNSALKESTWGNERYRFTWTSRPEYKRFYDMITDEMLLEGYNIASQLFRDKHRDAIDELFRQITDVDAELNADARAELEKNIKRFTDYRTYLSFDLVVTDSEGRTQRLSKTLQKKSGGETQTPFYISVLASFAQLYRIQDRAYNRIRLIVFDEAFSKMDSERIQESIRLLRKFGFQCILSAPPEKIGDIAPLVDRNLCVIREKTTSIIRAFDSQKLLEEEFDEL